MRYFTKEWYDLCQRTDLHSDVKVYKAAYQKDEDLYMRLRNRKEKEFINLQREIYDIDPRELLEDDGSVYVLAEKFIAGGEIYEEDLITYHMSEEEKDHIYKLIEEYDARKPFDPEQSRKDFNNMQENLQRENKGKLPAELSSQIADPRVFALGYCTKEIRNQLKRLSKENEKKVEEAINAYAKVQEEEVVPEQLSERFSFHDCQIKSCQSGQDIVLYLDKSGGFTDDNKISFLDAKVLKQERPIVESFWLYEELYAIRGGYEAHMLFASAEDIHEFTISCKDILLEKL